MQPHDQVARAPAHHTMDGRDRALMDDLGQKGLVRLIELWGAPGEGILTRSVRVCSLKRITQSRSVCRSMPAFVAASVRELPSSTAAIASSRRACAASFACFANRRTSAAV